jgi:hypothetical protein
MKSFIIQIHNETTSKNPKEPVFTTRMANGTGAVGGRGTQVHTQVS